MIIWRRFQLELALPLLGLVVACSSYFGPGPDPSAAGPYNGGRSNLGGSNGISGSDNLGANPNNGGGGNSSCQPKPLDSVLDLESADCVDVKSCAETACQNETQQCLGPDYERGNVNGACMSFVNCQNGCGCNDNCRANCVNNGNGNSACADCLLMLQSCLQQSCPKELGACQAKSNKPALLTTNLSTTVSALVLDGDSLYFTTFNGVASIPKAGGKATALGGYKNLNGLAVAGGFIYISLDSGGVTRMKLDGSEPMQIVTTSFGGGSGPIVLDDTSLYYLSGPYVRRAPLAGGVEDELADDVWQQGFNGGQRLAEDDRALYYVGGSPMPGSNSQLMAVQKDAPAIGNAQPNSHPGALLTTAQGDIRGIATDGKLVYYADFGSDGLSMVVQVMSIDPLTKKTKVLGSVDAMNNTGGATAIATDGGRVFFGAGTGLYSLSTSGGDLKTLAGDAQPTAIALDDTYVYWAEQNNSGTIKRLPKTITP